MGVEETPIHSRANPTDTPTLNTTSFLLGTKHKKKKRKNTPPPQKVQNNLRATNKRGEFFFSPHAAVFIVVAFLSRFFLQLGQSIRSPSDQAGASKCMAKQQGRTPSGQETRRT